MPTEPLPGDLQAFLSEHFQRDLSDVGVTTGAAADARLQELGAKAATVGEAIYLGQPLSPMTASLAGLIGHEVAHLLQHRQGRFPGPGGLAEKLEAEAQAHEDRIRSTYRVAPRAFERLAVQWPEESELSPQRRPSIEALVSQGLERRLRQALPGRSVHLPRLLVEIVSQLAGDDEAIAAQLIEETMRAAERAAPPAVLVGASPAGNAQLASEAGQELADRMANELDDFQIAEKWLLDLIRTGRDGRKQYSDTEVREALELLKDRTWSGDEPNFFDKLLKEIADEGQASYAQLMDRIHRIHAEHLLALPTQTVSEFLQVRQIGGTRSAFLTAFEAHCKTFLLMLITGVEQQASQALIHYTQVGIDRGSLTSAESQELFQRLRGTARAGEAEMRKIDAQRAIIRDAEAEQVRLRQQRPRIATGAGYMSREAAEAIGRAVRANIDRIAAEGRRITAAKAEIERLEGEYRTAVADHPVLLMEGISTGELAAMRTGSDTRAMGTFQPKLEKVLLNCRKSKGYVYADDFNIWMMPHVLAAVKNDLTLTATQRTWIQEKVDSEKFWKTAWAVITAIVEIGLGIGAALTAPVTGGGSLVAFVAFTAAGVGVGAYTAYKSTVAYGRAQAFRQSSLSRWDNVLRQEGLNPDEKDLWIEWAGVIGFGVFEVVGVFKTVKVAKAVKSVSRGSRSLSVAARELGVAEDVLRAATNAHIERLLRKGTQLPDGLARVRLEGLGFSKEVLDALPAGQVRRLGSMSNAEFTQMAQRLELAFLQSSNAAFRSSGLYDAIITGLTRTDLDAATLDAYRDAMRVLADARQANKLEVTKGMQELVGSISSSPAKKVSEDLAELRSAAHVLQNEPGLTGKLYIGVTENSAELPAELRQALRGFNLEADNLYMANGRLYLREVKDTPKVLVDKLQHAGTAANPAQHTRYTNWRQAPGSGPPRYVVYSIQHGGPGFDDLLDKKSLAALKAVAGSTKDAPLVQIGARSFSFNQLDAFTKQAYGVLGGLTKRGVPPQRLNDVADLFFGTLDEATNSIARFGADPDAFAAAVKSKLGL